MNPQHAETRLLTYTVKNNITDSRGDISCLSFSPLGQWLGGAVGTNMVIWQVRTGDRLYSHDGYAPPVLVSWCPRTETAYCVFDNGWFLTVLLDHINGVISTQAVSTTPCQAGAMHATGELLALCHKATTTIWQRSNTNGFEWQATRSLELPGYLVRFGDLVEVKTVFWADDVDVHDILICYRTHGLVTWDVTSSLNRPTVVTTLDGGEVISACGYPGSFKIVAAHDHIGFNLYERPSSMPNRTFMFDTQGHNPATCPVSFAHGDRYLLCSGINSATLWRGSGNKLQTLPHEGSCKTGIVAVASVYIANDDVFRIATARGTTIKVWETIRVDGEANQTHMDEAVAENAISNREYLPWKSMIFLVLATATLALGYYLQASAPKLKAADLD